MAFTLYDAFVPSCQQVLAGLLTVIDKGEAHVKDNGLSDSDLIEARLADDMWNLPWHVRSCWLHSANTLEQIPGGEFTPDFTELPQSWDAMRALVGKAQAKLDAVSADDIDAIADKTIGFVFGGKRLMEFKGADFLLSFNQPNFYFHATTFYDILRHKGVELTKRDYMGPARIISA